MKASWLYKAWVVFGGKLGRCGVEECSFRIIRRIDPHHIVLAAAEILISSSWWFQIGINTSQTSSNPRLSHSHWILAIQFGVDECSQVPGIFPVTRVQEQLSRRTWLWWVLKMEEERECGRDGANQDFSSAPLRLSATASLTSSPPCPLPTSQVLVDIEGPWSMVHGFALCFSFLLIFRKTNTRP